MYVSPIKRGVCEKMLISNEEYSYDIHVFDFLFNSYFHAHCLTLSLEELAINTRAVS